MPVCMRLCLAYLSDSAATSMSFSTARVSAHIVGHVTAFDISITELKSPGLDIGNPASMTSTPSLLHLFGHLDFLYRVQAGIPVLVRRLSVLCRK